MITDEEFEELQNRPFSQNDWLWFYTQAVEQLVLEKVEKHAAAKDTTLRKAKDALAEYATDETKYGWTAIAAIVEIDKEIVK